MDTIQLEQKALAIPDQANALVITDSETYTRATDLLLSVKELLKEVEKTFNPIIDKQYQAHREALAQKKRHQDPLLRAELILKPRIAAYLDEQERQRRLAEKKANEEAALQEALDAESLGDKECSEAALNGHGVSAVSIPSSAPKVAGIATRELWSAEVTDLMTLVKAVAAGQVPLACLLANQSALNQQARALKQDMKYPGVKPICIKTVVAGSRL